MWSRAPSLRTESKVAMRVELQRQLSGRGSWESLARDSLLLCERFATKTGTRLQSKQLGPNGASAGARYALKFIAGTSPMYNSFKNIPHPNP